MQPNTIWTGPLNLLNRPRRRARSRSAMFQDRSVGVVGLWVGLVAVVVGVIGVLFGSAAPASAQGSVTPRCLILEGEDQFDPVVATYGSRLVDTAGTGDPIAGGYLAQDLTLPSFPGDLPDDIDTYRAVREIDGQDVEGSLCQPGTLAEGVSVPGLEFGWLPGATVLGQGVRGPARLSWDPIERDGVAADYYEIGVTTRSSGLSILPRLCVESDDALRTRRESRVAVAMTLFVSGRAPTARLLPAWSWAVRGTM